MISLRQLVIFLLPTSIHARLLGLPTSPFTHSDGEVRLDKIKSIVVDSKYADSIDERGETLIPPMLLQFASTFADDLKWSANAQVSVQLGHDSTEDSIFLTVGNASDYLDAAGRETPEGYSLSVSSSGITITGASPLGVWWGTRTLLQQVILSNGSLPYGSGTDSPGWGTRGMMLDAGRHYYPPEFLIEMCSYMSFFKQNTFHLHLSDNLYNNVRIYSRERSLDLYARFRLWSDSREVAGLNKYKNESYTREQFDHIQSSCAARGVTIFPEIEAPGHALAIVQWKPELGLEEDLSLLNISHPETISTMKSIWSTFLPWFHTKMVHIGADEYTADVNDYNIFVNAMADHIKTESNKSIRIWGTFPPKYTDGYVNIYQNVSIQHWEYFEDNPYHDYILNNYSVLNSDDAFYVVNKWSGSYPQTVNIVRTFNGNPSTKDGLWYPYIFNMRNSTDNPLRSEPLVLGEIAPLWNDYGPNSSVYSEAYYAWRDGVPALADKQWGGDLTAAEFPGVLSGLHPFIPGQNLDRSIPSQSSTIFQYSFEDSYIAPPNASTTIPDLSGNAYNGSTTCSLAPSSSALLINSRCSLTTPLSSKGRNYSLTLSLVIHSLTSPANATLISGHDSSLMLTPGITFFASGNHFRLNTTVPLNQKVHLSIVGRGNQTFARVAAEGVEIVEEEFLTKMGINGERFVWGPLAIEAPLERIGGEGCGWEGEVSGWELRDQV
ncbi:glycoside hydrolase family 20 protein [Zopfia rhizophila CBS 207.26]|uniref:beta-N-acetylhexosaminidase n=1 Tax=Zopfia rhizophila CBS 207.26 TaxID=1314779 RepID=A0A6A6DF37_9PEZI|nr:glycoside hydrolase family 20 protein [Zopfia rhizophila CBS 207.26]